MFKVMTLVFALVSFSMPSLQAQETPAESIIPLQSCHQDYVQRRKQLVRKALITPVVGAIAVPIGIYGGAAVGAQSGDFWGALVYAIIGAYGAILATAGVETFTLVALIKANSLVKLIEEAYAGKGKRLERYVRSVKRELDRDVTTAEVADALTKADMSGILCDGSMRGKKPDAKLRKRLARKTEITWYLVRALR